MSDTEQQLSRKDLLKLSAALGAGAVVGGRIASASGAPTRVMKERRRYCSAVDNFFVPPRIVCYRCRDDNQSLARFWNVVQPTTFHDDTLARATSEIQGVLDNARSMAPAKSDTLSFIAYDSRLFLVWARTVTRPKKPSLDMSDGFGRVIKGLGLRPAKNQRPRPPVVWIKVGNQVYCQGGKPGNCADGLWHAARTTRWHTIDLAEATGAVEFILDRTRAATPPGRQLSIVWFDYQPLLVWTVPGNAPPGTRGITANDDYETVAEALRLKVS